MVYDIHWSRSQILFGPACQAENRDRSVWGTMDVDIIEEDQENLQ